MRIYGLLGCATTRFQLYDPVHCCLKNFHGWEPSETGLSCWLMFLDIDFLVYLVQLALNDGLNVSRMLDLVHRAWIVRTTTEELHHLRHARRRA